MDVNIKHRLKNDAVYEEAKRLGLSTLLTGIVSARIDDPKLLADVIEPTIDVITPALSFTDGERAVERIVDAIRFDQTIGILTDYDVDGITSHTVILKSLRDIFKVSPTKLHSIIGHRVNDGYGISLSIVDTVLQLDPKPDLIITADMGSSDEPRIKLLKEAGIDVVVTDHHALPVEGHPVSAYACINPSRVDCNYPDSTIAGCMVAWLTMLQTRASLIAHNLRPASTPLLTELLSYVALGTIADCVSVGSSITNRLIVKRGLQVMNRLQQPCWKAIAQVLGDDSLPFDADTLGFQLAPRINARSRLDDPYAALHYMEANNVDDALRNLEILNSDNEDRKAIERTMTEEALLQIQPAVEADMPVLVAFLEQGHPGVQGIVASRITERYGKPSFVLTPTLDDTKVGGSGRSVDQIHIRNAMQRLHESHPDVFVKFGGHAGAAGLTMYRAKIDVFKDALNQIVIEELNGQRLVPQIYTDGALEPEDLTLKTVRELNALAPYGRGFDRPSFDGEFTLKDYRLIGKDKTHASLTLSAGDKELRAIWFKCVEEGADFPFAINQRLRCVYQLTPNTFRGKTTLQLMLNHVNHV